MNGVSVRGMLYYIHSNSSVTLEAVLGLANEAVQLGM